jgi:hypothetical protein
VTDARPELPAITAKDMGDLALAAELGADFVALSFVRSAGDIEQLRTLLEEHRAHARTVAKVEKIEKIEAYEHLDEIIAVADGEMVARGDTESRREPPGRCRSSRRPPRTSPRSTDGRGRGFETRRPLPDACCGRAGRGARCRRAAGPDVAGRLAARVREVPPAPSDHRACAGEGDRRSARSGTGVTVQETP